MTVTLKLKSHGNRTLKEFQEFTFIGNSNIEVSENYSDQLKLPPNSICLTELNPGKSLFLTQICSSQSIVHQLARLNFKPGQKIDLESKTPNGSVVVSLNNKLVGIGAEIAQNILVTLAE